MNRRHILVVDDDTSVREVLCSLLGRASCSCDAVDSAAQALASLENREYELMFSDLNMPVVSGITLLSGVVKQYPDMPVVVVTGMSDVRIALSAIRKGAYDYILKPFNRDELLVTLERALEYRTLKLRGREYLRQLESLVAARTEQLRETLDSVEKSYDITLEAFGDALDLKDSETHGHSKRVTAFTIVIARRIGLSINEICAIARGAFLHDIGTISVPDAILRKPGPLDEPEWEIMHDHCYRGYQIVRKIPFLSQAAEIVYAHQEKFDGSGYPRQLKGEEIPLGARIFAVADALDAITSDRPYRAARSICAARDEILNCSGQQFDPAIVETFLMIKDEVWHELRQGLALPSNGTNVLSRTG